MSMQTHEAIRVPFPNGEEQQQEGLIVEKVMGLFESLRSTDPPSGPSTCTNIPVNSGVDLCVSEKNYGGRAMAPPRPYQHLMSPVGIMQQFEAIRILDDEEEELMIINKDIVLQSLPKGPVPPSRSNGCTNIPNQGGAPCTNQRNFAGHAVAPPQHAYPGLLVPNFGVATDKPQ
ncbi:hypothetical protein GH714_036569 [Hevea brasiliensis]|uniref:Uncharacterized protein n=1 Tax=Hevea brasiliensis TaxID=3981 RepID=A0A6A6LR19_HEVBR|nr:hypothetical protein GH714_036569 [Hevea brasiliensis]